MTYRNILPTAATVFLALTGTASASPKAPPKETIQNLIAAFHGETMAFSKYRQFAKKAKSEGNEFAYRLFSAASRAEGYHARNHKRVLDGLGVSVQPQKYTGKPGTTLQNLKAAQEGEVYERETMYPEFIATAKREGVDMAVQSFQYALQAETTHARLYALAQRVGKDSKGRTNQEVRFFVCPTCGETFMGKGPQNCTVCFTPKLKFLEVK